MENSPQKAKKATRSFFGSNATVKDRPKHSLRNAGDTKLSDSKTKHGRTNMMEQEELTKETRRQAALINSIGGRAAHPSPGQREETAGKRLKTWDRLLQASEKNDQGIGQRGS